MAAQIEVKFKGMSDAGIYCCPCRDVPTLSNLFNKKKKKSLNKYLYMCLSIYLTIEGSPSQTCQHRRGVCGGVSEQRYK